MKGNSLTIVGAVLLTIGRVEREEVAAEADGGIVLFQPGHAENNVMGSRGDV